eukprot:8572469-Ditylum_brightwellii.AAC.1
MATLHHITKCLTREQRKDLFIFNKSIIIFAQSSKGILHAGDLLSHHLLVIGGAIGVYSLEFTLQGEIGDTHARSSIQGHF